MPIHICCATLHCALLEKNIPTPINNPYAHAISDTMRKDARQRKERSTKIWHQHRGAADQALPSTTPSTLDDFQPCPMNSWCLSVVFVVICWIFENSLLISNSLSIWCLILRASCYHSDCSPKFLAFWAGRGWVHLQNVAHIDTSTRKLTEILNC